METTEKEALMKAKVNLCDVETAVRSLMQQEDRRDAEFRYLLFLSQAGDIGKYLTHDPRLNPDARPYGTKGDEVLSFGQAFVQLVALALVRGVSLEQAVQQGLRNWEGSDWRAVRAEDPQRVLGRVACPGHVVGLAYVVSEENPLEHFLGGAVLVVAHAEPRITSYPSALAYVTDHGGKTCHAATIARDRGIPCIVGTGNATKLIEHGQWVVVDARGKEGFVFSKEGE